MATVAAPARLGRVRLLFVGDVVGGIGRRTLAALLPALVERHRPDFVVVNGENAAGGVGITERTALEILEMGVDCITLGNHAYRHPDVYDFLDRDQRIVRPANYPKGSPGRGAAVVERDGMTLGVVNLSGTVFLDAARSPYYEADAVLADLRDRASHVLVDMHAEATSEKVAMGWHLDGRVTACVGTHTHVPTADARVLPGGTAYCTDVGMTGPRGGVIGVKRELVLKRFLTMTSVRFDTATEDPWLNAVLVDSGADGRATAIEQLLVPWPNRRVRAQRQHDHADQGDVAQRDEPPPARLARDHVRVVDGELHQGEEDGDSAGGGQPPHPPREGERAEWRDPDEVLRGQHLPERGERGHGGERRKDKPSLRGWRSASTRRTGGTEPHHPDEQDCEQGRQGVRKRMKEAV